MSEEVVEVEWDDVMATLKVLIEDVNNTSSELCELKAFDMVRGLQKNVLKDLNAMYSYADKRLHGGKYSEEELELSTEEFGGQLQILMEDDAREVRASGDYSKISSTNRRVRMIGARIGDVLFEEATSINYVVVGGSDLPPRGTGLEIGAAGNRRAGLPRTEEERRLRHEELYGEEEELF